MPESATARLLEAVKDDDIEAGLKALKEGANIRARYQNGKTMLEFAMLNGNLSMLKMLVEHGADANIKTGLGESMLYIAMEYGSMDMIKYLIEHGASVNGRSKRSSILAQAIKSRRHDVAIMLLDNGADPNT